MANTQIEEFIKTKDFYIFIKDYIYSEDCEKMFNSTLFFEEPNSQKIFQAMQHGIIWASVLIGSSSIPKYYGEIEIKNNE